MTAVVGIKCKDGIVIGTDSASTFVAGSLRTIEQKIDKICIVGDNVIIAGTGQVGLQQRFCDLVQVAHKDNLFSNKYIDIGRILAQRTIQDFLSTRIGQGSYGALLAYALGDQFHLCEFADKDFQPEWKDNKVKFVSMGSGQPITDPFLGLMKRVFWKDMEPTVADATFITAWALWHAIDLNAGGINGPIQMAVIRKNEEGVFKATLLTEAELEQHKASMEDAEAHLGKYKDMLLGKNAEKIPTLDGH